MIDSAPFPRRSVLGCVLVAAGVLAGCGSTHVIQSDWDASTAAEMATWPERSATVVTGMGTYDGVSIVPEGDRVRLGVAVPNAWHRDRVPGSPLFWRYMDRASVREVSVTRRSRWRGALFGALVGTGLGAFMGYARGATHANGEVDPGLSAAAFGTIGGAAMGLAGYAVGTRRTTIYQFEADSDDRQR